MARRQQEGDLKKIREDYYEVAHLHCHRQHGIFDCAWHRSGSPPPVVWGLFPCFFRTGWRS